jgi:hypothetical protein
MLYEPELQGYLLNHFLVFVIYMGNECIMINEKKRKPRYSWIKFFHLFKIKIIVIRAGDVALW